MARIPARGPGRWRIAFPSDLGIGRAGGRYIPITNTQLFDSRTLPNRKGSNIQRFLLHISFIKSKTAYLGTSGPMSRNLRIFIETDIIAQTEKWGIDNRPLRSQDSEIFGGVRGEGKVGAHIG